MYKKIVVAVGTRTACFGLCVLHILSCWPLWKVTTAGLEGHTAIASGWDWFFFSGIMLDVCKLIDLLSIYGSGYFGGFFRIIWLFMNPFIIKSLSDTVDITLSLYLGQVWS